jgi:hypothetical protein
VNSLNIKEPKSRKSEKERRRNDKESFQKKGLEGDLLQSTQEWAHQEMFLSEYQVVDISLENHDPKMKYNETKNIESVRESD